MADRKQGAGLSSGSSGAVHKAHYVFFLYGGVTKINKDYPDKCCFEK